MQLTLEHFCEEAKSFVCSQDEVFCQDLFPITDGKAIGTYLEQKLKAYLSQKYTFEVGNSSYGIDFPSINVDIKTTSVRQPQSSCPFSSARQKIYGLGYHLIVFVYEKLIDDSSKCAALKFHHTLFIDKSVIADYQTTQGLRDILDRSGNLDDIQAFLYERCLPGDEIVYRTLAEEIYNNPPNIGYLTISNALQWRLQYTRAIQEAGRSCGILSLR